MENLKMVIFFIIGICAICSLIYGGCWIARTMSYSFFYEDLVEQTIKGLVRQEALY